MGRWRRRCDGGLRPPAPRERGRRFRAAPATPGAPRGRRRDGGRERSSPSCWTRLGPGGPVPLVRRAARPPPAPAVRDLERTAAVTPAVSPAERSWGWSRPCFPWVSCRPPATRLGPASNPVPGVARPGRLRWKGGPAPVKLPGRGRQGYRRGGVQRGDSNPGRLPPGPVRRRRPGWKAKAAAGWGSRRRRTAVLAPGTTAPPVGHRGREGPKERAVTPRRQGDRIPLPPAGQR